jgi:hypothetical protein
MNIKKITGCFAGVMLAMSLFAVNDQDKKTFKIGKSVNSGYLFYDGGYVEAPYEFKRRGFAVFVNGHKIYFPEGAIKYLLRNRNIENVNIAEIPKNITYEEFNNPEKPWGAYISRKIQEINISSQTPNETKKRIIGLYSKLPFVKKVYEHKEFPNSLIVIETYHGDKMNVLLPKKEVGAEQKKERFITKSDVEKLVEKECAEKNRKALENGCCVFLFSSSPARFVIPPGDVMNNLPEIIDVLKSADSVNLKINKLYRLRVFPERKNKMAKIIVNNFKDNKQLSDRIAVLLNDRVKTNFKRIKIENRPTKEEMRNVQIKAWEDKQEKWRKAHPEEYKRQQKAQKLYFEKVKYISEKGQKYWENHKEELEKKIAEIKKLKAQMQ